MSSNSVPDGHWAKGSTTTAMMKYVEHVCSRARALETIPVETEIFELIEALIAIYHIG